jgi:hypothetical protein
MHFDINYKELDTERILIYIESFDHEVPVDEIIANSGADKLRIYPLLFELEHDGMLEVCQRDMFGAPLAVKFLSRKMV